MEKTTDFDTEQKNSDLKKRTLDQLNKYLMQNINKHADTDPEGKNRNNSE